MGQAKNRGSFEQRLKLSVESGRPTAKARRQRSADDEAALWDSFTTAEKEVVMAKQAERTKMRRTLTGLIGMSALLSGGQDA